MEPPAGCVFHPRCPRAAGICSEKVPALRNVGGSRVACHFAE
jgi:dipeptide transport system ATP-binding protein